MKQLRLSAEERSLGFTHKFNITAADVAALGAATSGVIVLAPYTLGTILRPAAWRVVTAFAGGSISALTAKIGYNGTANDDDDALSEAKSILSGASPVLVDAGSLAVVDASTVDNTYGQQENDVITSLRTRVNILRQRGFGMVESGNVEITFTSTTDNLSAVTTGEINVYLSLVDLTVL